MQIHRLLRKDHSESLLKGSFRFVRLRYYQMLEVVFEDQSIGDEQEGTTSALVNAILASENADDLVRNHLAKSGFSVAGNGRCELKDVRFRNDLDCFVSCWSTRKTPNFSGSGPDYDTCVTAAEADLLFDCLSAHANERESGAKISSLFRLERGAVRYENSEHDISTGPLPSGDPFRKRTRYQDQFEYRLVLVPHQTMAVDSVFVECPEATELLASVSTKELYKESLAFILDEWASLPRALAEPSTWGDQYSEACKEFDRIHLKNLQRALFELRGTSVNERLDRAIALRYPSSLLISHYESQLW